MNSSLVVEVLFGDCRDRAFITKTIYKRLEDFNHNRLTPALKQFMQQSFHIPQLLLNDMEEKNFDDLQKIALRWAPWRYTFEQWDQELHSVSVLWKNVISKSNETFIKFQRDVKFIICLLNVIRRPDLCSELVNMLYYM